MDALRLTVAAFALAGSFGTASAQDRAAVEAGEALYAEHCAECHGENSEAPARCRTYRICAKTSGGTLTRP
jgi:mono/diheme cytochrome c family protein